MIEKIIKVVKSGNKKKGRNITIGAVVGMLLSCTVVMGEDVSVLEITQETSGIKFSKGGTEFTPGNDKEDPKKDPYPENTWDKESTTYTNSSIISIEQNNGNVYGVKLIGDLNNLNFINNGLISGKINQAGYGYGIYIYNYSSSTNSITRLANNGNIYGSYGIYNYSDSSSSNSNIITLINNGSINGGTSGIYNKSLSSDKSSSIERLINNGRIYGNTFGIYNHSDSSSISNIENFTNNGSIVSGNYGIYNYSTNSGKSKITSLTNNGSITGKSSGIYNSTSNIENFTNNGSIYGNTSGISNYSNGSSSGIGKLINSGIIYGKTNAIYNYSSSSTISNAYNYGILVSNTGNITSGIASLQNHGLVFKVNSRTYKATDDDFKKFGQVSEDGGYKIINAKAKNNNKEDIEGTENLTLKKGKLFDTDKVENIDLNKKYILNGITDTLLVSSGKNILNNSVINAYKTAVVMNGKNLYLELNDTTVNGGLDGTIENSGNLKDYSPAILVTGDNNFLTISGDSIVNGKMSATGDKNTLNLYGKQNMTKSNDSESMNILHNIEGFGRIQIENNVTFFEDIKVTGVDRLNINNGGTLSLRLTAGATSNDKATHALNGNTNLLIAGKEEGDSNTAGTLNFITNGMGTGTIIDMGGIELENVYLKTSNILYKLEVLDQAAASGASANPGDIKIDTKGSLTDIYNERAITPDPYRTKSDEVLYNSLNKIYQSSIGTDDNVDAVAGIIDSSSDEEQWKKLLSFLGGVYTESPYLYSSELSRRSVGMFRDIVTENEFRPNQDKWLIMGGLTHADGGTKDTYYGRNYHGFDTGTSDTKADMKLTGAYMLAKYGYSENTSLGLTLGGNKSEAKMSMSKVKGNSGYLGAFAENYRGNLTLKAGAGGQYSEYDADRRTIGGHSYNDKYSDITYDIYLNGRYSHNIGKDLFLEPYTTLSYTYVNQDGANEGSKVLAIETDSKSFDYTVGKVGVDLKKVIPHEKGKSTLTAGVSYTKILDGADEEHITGRFKGGSDFDILVAHKNEHSIGLNAKYALELENGIIFDVKGTYSVERDSHNQSGKNRTKGEWIVGAGVGYKF